VLEVLFTGALIATSLAAGLFAAYAVHKLFKGQA